MAGNARSLTARDAGPRGPEQGECSGYAGKAAVA